MNTEDKTYRDLVRPPITGQPAATAYHRTRLEEVHKELYNQQKVINDLDIENGDLRRLLILLLSSVGGSVTISHRDQLEFKEKVVIRTVYDARDRSTSVYLSESSSVT